LKKHSVRQDEAAETDADVPADARNGEILLARGRSSMALSRPRFQRRLPGQFGAQIIGMDCPRCPTDAPREERNNPLPEGPKLSSSTFQEKVALLGKKRGSVSG